MTAPISSATNSSANALGNIVAGMLTGPAQIAAALAGAVTKSALTAGTSATGCSSPLGFSTSCCEIPPPCWEPQPAGTCSLQIAPGGSGTIRVHVTNCGWTRQIVGITALGRIAGLMSITPTARIVGPQERVNFLVTIHVPATAALGASATGPLIIRGCREHFARVEITVADCVTGNCNCCNVNVNDCADQIHHWYDHFYCPRPCNTVVVRDQNPVVAPGVRTSING